MLMATYSPKTLLQLWRQNELTETQAVGHALQHIATLTDHIAAIEKRLHQLEQTRPEPGARATPKSQS